MQQFYVRWRANTPPYPVTGYVIRAVNAAAACNVLTPRVDPNAGECRAELYASVEHRIGRDAGYPVPQALP